MSSSLLPTAQRNLHTLNHKRDTEVTVDKEDAGKDRAMFNWRRLLTYGGKMLLTGNMSPDGSSFHTC